MFGLNLLLAFACGSEKTDLFLKSKLELNLTDSWADFLRTKATLHAMCVFTCLCFVYICACLNLYTNKAYENMYSLLNP